MKYLTEQWLLRNAVCARAYNEFMAEWPDGKALLSDVVKKLQEKHEVQWLYWLMVQNLRILKAVLALGVTIASQDSFGYTPSMTAVCWEKLSVIKYLIALGSDVNHKNSGGESVLAFARKYSDSIAVVNILTEAGAK